MSGKLMGQVYGLQLTDAQQRVALALADHGNDKGEKIRPSFGLVGWKIQRSDRHVREIVRELESVGLLALVSEGGGHTPNEYRMDIKAVPVKPPREVPRRAHRSEAQSSDLNPNPDADRSEAQSSDLEPSQVGSSEFLPDGSQVGSPEFLPDDGPDGSQVGNPDTPGRNKLLPPNRHKEPPTTETSTSTPSPEKEETEEAHATPCDATSDATTDATTDARSDDDDEGHDWGLVTHTQVPVTKPDWGTHLVTNAQAPVTKPLDLTEADIERWRIKHQEMAGW